MPARRGDGLWKRATARPYSTEEWRAVRWGWWLQVVPVLVLSLYSLGLYPTVVFAWWQGATGRPWLRRLGLAVGCTALVLSVVGWVVAVPVTRRWYVLHRQRGESVASLPRSWWARHLQREAAYAERSRATGIWRSGLFGRQVGWLLFVGFAAWAVACPFANQHRVGCWFLPPIALLCYVLLLRPRVVASREGVQVRNLVRSFAAGWADVDRVQLGLRKPLLVMRRDGAVVKCGAGHLNALAIIQRRRCHADELADDLARRTAEYQGRPIDDIGGASSFSDEERQAVRNELVVRGVLGAIIAGILGGE